MGNVRIAVATVRTTDASPKTDPEGIVLRGTFGRTPDGRRLLAVAPDHLQAGIDADLARTGRAVRHAVARTLEDGSVVARAVA